MYSKTIEDYLEKIYDISQKKGYARTTDISRRLEISPPSVTEMLGKLDDMSLVNYERYGGVTLTSEGERIGRSIKKRHDTLRTLLRILFVPEKTAERDACRIEHELSPETVEQLMKFVDFIECSPKCPKWLEHFREFCRTGEYPRDLQGDC